MPLHIWIIMPINSEWLIELTPLQADWVQPKGIDRSIEYIDSLDLENKRAVVGSLLENTYKKEEVDQCHYKKIIHAIRS